MCAYTNDSDSPPDSFDFLTDSLNFPSDSHDSFTDCLDFPTDSSDSSTDSLPLLILLLILTGCRMV